MNQPHDIAERLRRVEDRLAIEELLARYANACDDRDFQALAGCFAEAFEFDSVAGHSVGRDAALSYYAERLGSYGVTFHVPHTLVLEDLGEDSAYGIVTSHAEMEIEHEVFVTGFRYHDRYTRDAGTWRFLSRQVRAFYAMPLRELAGRLDPLRVRWPGTEPKAAPLPELLPSWEAFRRASPR
jgi:hypothetical protein